jgi:RNA polymerase sigma factor for flagellar operon FliA
MVARHAPMVRRLALRLLARLPASVELDDLVQAGMMGLLDAVRRYREVPTAQFETYATQRVRGAMLDELRGNDWIPRGVRERSRRIEQAIHALGNRLARAPTETEVAQEMGVSLGEYHTLLQESHGSQLLYLDDLGGDHEQFLTQQSDGDPIHVQETDDPLAALMAKGLRGALTAAIEKLPEREKLLLSLYYEQGLNLKEIGLVLNVGEARVCQLRSQAISRLRAGIVQYEAGD